MLASRKFQVCTLVSLLFLLNSAGLVYTFPLLFHPSSSDQTHKQMHELTKWAVPYFEML